MSGGGSGGGNNTTVTKQELPAYAQPYAEQMLSRGTALSQQPYQPYTGQRMADMAPETQAGLSMTRDRALAGNPAVNASTDMLARTAAGEYMDPGKNPYFQPYMSQVQGMVNNQFARPGAFGGSAHQELLTRNLGDAAGKFYEGERANQMRAAALAPQLAQQDYADAQQLLGVGDVYGQRQQDLLNLAYEQWMEGTNYPYQQLDVLANTLAGSTGGRSTTISQGAPLQYSRAANALGGGLLGYGVGSMAPSSAMGGYAPYLGAGAGLLGGLAL
jgi:hypothetical protein